MGQFEDATKKSKIRKLEARNSDDGPRPMTAFRQPSKSMPNDGLRDSKTGVYQSQTDTKTDDTVTPEMRAKNRKAIDFWISRALYVAQTVALPEGAWADTEPPNLYYQGDLKAQFDQFFGAERYIRRAVEQMVRARGFFLTGESDPALASLGMQPKDAGYAADPEVVDFIKNKSATADLDLAEPFKLTDLAPFRTEIQRLASGDSRPAATAMHDADIQSTLDELAKIVAWNDKYHGWTRCGPVYNTWMEQARSRMNNLRQALDEHRPPGEIDRLLAEGKAVLDCFPKDKPPTATLDEMRAQDKEGFHLVEDISSVLPGVGIAFNFLINQADITIEWAGGQLTNGQYITQTIMNVVNAAISKFPAKGFVKGVMIEFTGALATELNKAYAEVSRAIEESKDLSPQDRQTKIGIAMTNALSTAFVEALKCTVERVIERELKGKEIAEELVEAIKTLAKAATKLGLLSFVHAKIEEMEKRLEREIEEAQPKKTEPTPE